MPSEHYYLFRGTPVRTWHPNWENTKSFKGYLRALRSRRAFFKEMGATASDHSAQVATTVALSEAEATALFDKIICRQSTPSDAAIFRGYTLID